MIVEDRKKRSVEESVVIRREKRQSSCEGNLWPLSLCESTMRSSTLSPASLLCEQTFYQPKCCEYCQQIDDFGSDGKSSTDDSSHLSASGNEQPIIFPLQPNDDDENVVSSNVEKSEGVLAKIFRIVDKKINQFKVKD